MKLNLDENHWEEVYNGYGEINFTDDKIILKPKISTSPSETHSALVTSFLRVKDFTLEIKATTINQLRKNSVPNEWEVLWIYFNYNPTKKGKKTTNYFLLKPNGYELGSAWNQTDQCFIETGDSVKLIIGEEYTYQITKTDCHITISIDGVEIINSDINESDLYDDYGYIGLYTEDAEVEISSFEFFA